MHIAVVNFHHKNKEYLQNYFKIHVANSKLNFSYIQRGPKDYFEKNNHYIKDEFDPELKWWQNPEKLNNYIAKLNPDVVYIFGLNLPLHFRWLRHYINSETVLIAQHCGEGIWIQRNLWLQQFGLRVVNGFVFDELNDADPWLKCAAILKSQPVFGLSNFKNDIENIISKIEVK